MKVGLALAALALGLGAVSGRRKRHGGQPDVVVPVPVAAKHSLVPTYRDPSMVVSVDNWFIDHFIDPFQGDEAIEVPPVIVAEDYMAEGKWATGDVVVPELLDALRVDLWHGTRTAVKPFEDQDLSVRAVAKNPQVVDKLKVTLSQVGTTSKVTVKMSCAKAGQSKVMVVLARRGHPAVTFGAVKRCGARHSNELRVSVRGGINAFDNGGVAPEFNIHDLQGRSFVADKSDAVEGLIFHTLHKEYRIVGAPEVKAYAATDEMLEWAKERYASLGAVVDSFQSAFSADAVKDEEFYEEDEDADEDYAEQLAGEQGDAYGDASLDSGALVKAATPPPTVTLDLHPTSHVVREVSHSCQPSLSGSLMDQVASVGYATIAHRKDFSEKKLQGFAQAGVLGVHGGVRLELKYNCLHDGLSVIELSFEVEPLANNGARIKGANRRRVEMSWLKVCLAEQIADDEIDMMGFNVHLGTYSPDEPAFFPVLNGITTETYTWDGASMVAAPEELSSSFYVRLADLVEEVREEEDAKLGVQEEFIRIQSVRFASQHRYHRLVEPTLSGHAVNGGIVTPESMPIQVHYTCKKSGKVRIGLDLLVDVVTLDSEGNAHPLVGRRRKVSFYWVKHCSLTPLDQLSVRTVDPQLFTADDGSDLLRDVAKPSQAARLKADQTFNSVEVFDKSTPKPLFVATQSSELDQSTLYTVLADQSSVSFELRKNIGRRRAALFHPGRARDTDSQMGLLFGEPVLSSASSNVKVSLRNIGAMETLSVSSKEDFLVENGIAGFEAKQADQDHLFEKEMVFEVTTRDPVFLVVDHECVAPGPALITLQVPVYANAKHVVAVQWIKRCGDNDVQVLTGSDTNFFVALAVTIAVLMTSLTCCAYIKKQHDQLAALKARTKPEGFETMETVAVA